MKPCKHMVLNLLIVGPQGHRGGGTRVGASPAPPASVGCHRVRRMPDNARRITPSATILLVEDDPKIASFLKKGLQHEGFHVDWVTSGEKAISRLEDGGVDLQLLDLGLPDVDGLEVLRELRRRGMDVPVIVVTGRTDPRDRATALSLGVSAYLTKPFPWTQLLSAVREALEESLSPRSENTPEMGDRS
jgi:DNA-binding response OmpR family regulator